MQRAEAAYSQRNYTAALDALAAASGMIRQMKADAWKAVLPAPPVGWTAGPAKTMTVAPALLGGGTSIERQYFRADGASVDVSLIADAPMLQSVATLLGAGMLLSGSETMQIEGQRVAYDADDNTLQAIVADKMLVKMQGSAGVDKRTLEDFFRAADFGRIATTPR